MEQGHQLPQADVTSLQLPQADLRYPLFLTEINLHSPGSQHMPWAVTCPAPSQSQVSREDGIRWLVRWGSCDHPLWETCELFSMFQGGDSVMPQEQGWGSNWRTCRDVFLDCACLHPPHIPSFPYLQNALWWVSSLPKPHFTHPHQTSSCLETGLGVPSQPQGLFSVCDCSHLFSQQTPTEHYHLLLWVYRTAGWILGIAQRPPKGSEFCLRSISDTNHWIT